MIIFLQQYNACTLYHQTDKKNKSFTADSSILSPFFLNLFSSASYTPDEKNKGVYPHGRELYNVHHISGGYSET